MLVFSMKLLLVTQLLKKVIVSVQSMTQPTLLQIIMTVFLSFILVISALQQELSQSCSLVLITQ
jgi:hypothetical protein